MRFPALAAGLQRRWVALTAAAPVVILAVVGLLEPHFTYNRWDNFEYFTSAIVAAHEQWLEGDVPFWNPHQHLGEPLLGTMQPAVLYFPYTVICGLIRLLGLPRSVFPLASVALHTMFAAAGWYRLLRWFGARPEVGFVTGVSASLSGFATLLSSVWIYMAPICGWLPWLMRWTLQVVSGSASRGTFVWLVVGLTAIVYAGQPQMAVYTWVFVAVLGAAYWLVATRRAREILALAGAAGVAVLTSAPFWLPGYLYLAGTARAGAVSLDEFLGRAVPPGAWVETLLPVYCYNHGFLPGRASVYLHQGAWVGPAILAALAVAWLQRGRLEGLGRPLAVALGCAAVFYELARGGYGPLLRLTYGLPIWSSFRDAFKFSPFFLAAAALAAGIGLEICWRQQRGRPWLVGLGGALAVAAGLLLAFPGLVLHLPCPSVELLGSRGGRLSLVAGLGLLVLAPAGGLRRVRQVLLMLVPLETAGLVALCHYHAHHTYHKPYGAVGAAQLGIQNQYRVLPLSDRVYSPEAAIEEYGSFHSATANGYYSATGHYSSYMAPRWRSRWLHINEHGVPMPPWNHALVGSHLLRSFNVRYVIVGKQDAGNLALISGHPAYRLLRELGETRVYEDPQALPRAYFATETRPYSEEDLERGLLENRAPLTAAYAEDWSRPGEAKAGEVQELTWGNGVIRARVQASTGGFLVISTTWDAGWHAHVDGAPARVYRVNGTLLGLALPPGARQVVVRYTAPGFAAGLGLLGAGMAVLTLWGWPRRRPSNP